MRSTRRPVTPLSCSQSCSRRGPPRSFEQHVGRAIVAVDQHPRHQAARAIAVDRVVERAAAVIDLREVERGNRDLHRARHRERRVALDADGFAGVEVERGDADVGRLAGDEDAQLLLEAPTGSRTRPPPQAARRTPKAPK